MPSPGEDLQSWSTTAASNGTADPLIDWHECQARASVNNSARSMLAAHAKNRNLLNGSIVTTGAANAQQFLSGLTYTTVPTNLVVRLKIGSGLTNTSSVTLNMDGIGDVLVKTASGDSLLGNEFPADNYVDLVYNGTNWIFLYSQKFLQDQLTGGGGIIIGQQIFSTAGLFPYTPTTGMECCIIECIGGGGGGGNAAANANEFLSAGGGGSGGYSRKLLTATAIGAGPVNVTVGVGGGGGAGGGGNGAIGGDTFVGAALATALCAAKGGLGGDVGIAGIIPGGGAGGSTVGAVGDIAAGGAAGGNGFDNRSDTLVFAKSGEGGSSVFGGGAQGVGTLQAGINAASYGSGGGGANSYNAGGGRIGGNGSAGVVIITEFSGRGAPGRDGPMGPQGVPGPSGSGTGDVLRSGTPTAGQYAVWTDASHIQGVDNVVAFSTGDMKPTFKSVADSGWVFCGNSISTIGSATSGASVRANADCLALFTLLYNNGGDTFNPVFTSAGAATTRAALGTAAAGWAANARITLPQTSSRDVGGAGAGTGLTAYGLGAAVGAETVTLGVTNLAPHVHGHPSGTNYMSYPGLGLGLASGPDAGVDNVANTASTGSGTPFGIVSPRVMVNWMIKL